MVKIPSKALSVDANLEQRHNFFFFFFLNHTTFQAQAFETDRLKTESGLFLFSVLRIRETERGWVRSSKSGSVRARDSHQTEFC